MATKLNENDGLHLFAKIAGGTNDTVHRPSKHVKRKPHLYYNEEEARFATVTNSGGGSHKIFYEIHGSGPIPIVLVMGLAAPHTQFEPQYYEFGKRLGSEYSVLILDNRGVGLSDTPVHRWRTSDLASDIIQLLHQIEKSSLEGEGKKWHSNVNLVGFSMGGMIALETILMDPGRFSTLTLMSTHAGGIRGTLPPPYGAKPMLATFGALGGVSALCAGIDLLYPKEHLDEELTPEDHKRYYEGDEPEHPIRTRREHYGHEMIRRARKYVESENFPEIRLPGVIMQVLAVVSHYISWDRLEAIKNWKIPVLVFSGEHDNLVDPFNSRMMAKALDGKHIHFKNGGHGINEQYDIHCNELLRQHFNHSNPNANGYTRDFNRKSRAPEILHPWKFGMLYLLFAFILSRKGPLKSLSNRMSFLTHGCILTILLRKYFGGFGSA